MLQGDGQTWKPMRVPYRERFYGVWGTAENNLFASIDDAGGAIAFRMQAKLTADASFDQTYLRNGPGIGPAGGLAGAIAQLYADFLSRLKTNAENPGIGRNVVLRLSSTF